jgi:hypothetical protein
MTIVKGEQSEWNERKVVRERASVLEPSSPRPSNIIPSSTHADAFHLYSSVTRMISRLHYMRSVFMNSVIIHVDGGWLLDNP